MNFFSFNFPLREYFFCTSPAPPPPPDKFSNGPSLREDCLVIFRKTLRVTADRPQNSSSTLRNEKQLLKIVAAIMDSDAMFSIRVALWA